VTKQYILVDKKRLPILLSYYSSDINKEIMAINEATNKLTDMSSQVSSIAEEFLGLDRRLQHF